MGNICTIFRQCIDINWAIVGQYPDIIWEIFGQYLDNICIIFGKICAIFGKYLKTFHTIFVPLFLQKINAERVFDIRGPGPWMLDIGG